MFDIHKDYLNKQQTLFTNATSLKPCFNEYKNTLDNVITNFMSLDYDHSNSIKALSKISTITSRAQVCIEQLLACEKSTQGSFKIEFYERKQLICDMDTIKNIFRCLQKKHLELLPFLSFQNQISLKPIKFLQIKWMWDTMVPMNLYCH